MMALRRVGSLRKAPRSPRGTVLLVAALIAAALQHVLAFVSGSCATTRTLISLVGLSFTPNRVIAKNYEKNQSFLKRKRE